MEQGEQFGEYKRLPIRQFQSKDQQQTAESSYWKAFKSTPLVPQIGAVTHVEYCKSSPHDVAVTSSTRVLIYDGRTGQLKRKLTRFKDIAYSGCFRTDGKLLAAGGETGLVQVFDAGSRAVLRHLKGHSRAVHHVQFSRDKIHLLSAGDDATVRLWDLAAEAPLLQLRGHGDYVRSASCSPANHDLWATGSYDHTVRLWDTRSGKEVFSLKHSRPVEDVVFFPAGTLLATAAGPSITVWDVVGGGRPLRHWNSHQKTVTTLKLAPRLEGTSFLVAPPGPRLLAGGADGHVKAYELSSFKMVHSVKYPGPVLSLDLAPDCSSLAVGLANGQLALRPRRSGPPKVRPRALNEQVEKVRQRRAQMLGIKQRRQMRRKRQLRADNYRYFLRGQNARPSYDSYLVTRRPKAHFATFDRMLRQFRYGEALSAALGTGRAPVVVSLLEELVARSALRTSVTNRDPTALGLLLGFLHRHMLDPKFSYMLIPLAHLLLDLHVRLITTVPTLRRQALMLRERVVVELKLQRTFAVCQGMLSPLLHASTLAASSATL